MSLFSVKPPKYNYCFTVWPDEERKSIPAAVFTLFRQILMAIEMELTEKEFNDLREEAFKFGLTFREIERRPYQEPESIK